MTYDKSVPHKKGMVTEDSMWLPYDYIYDVNGDFGGFL